MPIVSSSYRAALPFRNGFISTVYSGIIRKVKLKGSHRRERFVLSDGDFLDLDWSISEVNSKGLIIMLHGLEGSADRPYMTGASNLFVDHGFDVLRVNFRGCSGEENFKYRSYHSGETEDLKEIIAYVLRLNKYAHLYLKGFSLGGNVILKYLGETEKVPNQLKGAVAVSVPCDLKGSAFKLLKFYNKPYAIRFKRHLLRRLRKKQIAFPNRISDANIRKIKTLIDFDHQYTAKAHGFKDAFDYYKKSSSLQYLSSIKTPTLLINAVNDSFLSSGCYPLKEAKDNPNLYLEMPKHGGHVGFHLKGMYYYNELRALEFFNTLGL